MPVAAPLPATPVGGILRQAGYHMYQVSENLASEPVFRIRATRSAFV